MFYIQLTMMSTRIPSVINTCFQHKLLTKVHGQPTYESLQNPSAEIKANASSVPSTIGGGLYGHLGLILSDLRYATCSIHAASRRNRPANQGRQGCLARAQTRVQDLPSYQKSASLLRSWTLLSRSIYVLSSTGPRVDTLTVSVLC
jgi:hypothetical protein